MATDSRGSSPRFVDVFTQWLECTRSENPSKRYCHHHLKERDDAWANVSGSIIDYFRRAHDDAVRRLQRLIGLSLHPAGVDPAAPNGYPHGLPLGTLQGSFGEIIAGMCAEHGSPSGYDDWEVPAFLLRTHLVAFQQLERSGQTDDLPNAIPGRTGDDCLAFRRTEDMQIVAVLYCEAKCTLDHDSALISSAHGRAASSIVDLLQIIEVLQLGETPEATRWIDALRILRLQLFSEPTRISRHDAVVYVHKRGPVRNQTWIPTDQPHQNYTAGRPLDSFEIQLSDVSSRISAVYAREVWQ